MKNAEVVGQPQSSAADALEAQPILDGTVAGDATSHLYADGEPEGTGVQPSPGSRWRRFRNDPLVRTAAINLALILIWCGRW